MKFHTEYLTFNTKKHREYIHITPPVEAAVKKSGVREGLPAAGGDGVGISDAHHRLGVRQ